MTATIQYAGNLRCNALHLQSGTSIETDAPTDNRGKGERFSPTDLVCAALATCMITTIAIKASDMDIDLKGTVIDVKKYMLGGPRRIGKIDIRVNFPSTITLEENDKIMLQEIGDNCPVIKSLHPDIELNVLYQWG